MCLFRYLHNTFICFVLHCFNRKYCDKMEKLKENHLQTHKTILTHMFLPYVGRLGIFARSVSIMLAAVSVYNNILFHTKVYLYLSTYTRIHTHTYE